MVATTEEQRHLLVDENDIGESHDEPRDSISDESTLTIGVEDQHHVKDSPFPAASQTVIEDASSSDSHSSSNATVTNDPPEETESPN